MAWLCKDLGLMWIAGFRSRRHARATAAQKIINARLIATGHESLLQSEVWQEGVGKLLYRRCAKASSIEDINRIAILIAIELRHLLDQLGGPTAKMASVNTLDGSVRASKEAH